MPNSAPLQPGAADGMLPAAARIVPADRLPEAARRLLDHDRDMTPTMEEHHRSGLRIRVLHAEKRGDRYRRRVALLTEAGRPVLQGEIDIRLDLLPASARDDVLLGRKPLGGVLRDERVPHASRPAAFFTLPSTPELEEVLRFRGPADLCGRVNHLLSAGGEILAVVVEILPPAATLEPS